MEATIIISLVGLISIGTSVHNAAWIQSLQRRLRRNRELLRSYLHLIKMQRKTINEMTIQNEQLRDVVIKMTRQQAQMQFDVAFQQLKITCKN